MKEQTHIQWKIISYVLPFIFYHLANKAKWYVCDMTDPQGQNTFNVYV